LSGPEAFVARTSPWRGGLLVVGALVFVVAGGWFAGWFGDPPYTRRISPEVAYWVGWFSVLFFGLCGLIAARRMLDGRPRIVIDARGVTARDFSDDMIPWTHIRGWSARQVVRSKFLCLDVTEAGTFRRSGLAAMTGGANRGMGYGDVQLNVTGTDRSFAELEEAMRRFWPV
jgi:hypothetical protein